MGLVRAVSVVIFFERVSSARAVLNGASEQLRKVRRDVISSIILACGAMRLGGRKYSPLTILAIEFRFELKTRSEPVWMMFGTFHT